MFSPETPLPQAGLPSWVGEVLRLAPVLPDEVPLSWGEARIALTVWCSGRLRTQLAPALAACRLAAASGDIDSLLRAARAHADAWSTAEVERSLLAGRQLLECVHGARGHEAYLTLRDRWLSSGQPAWYHAVLAARAAFLHQPLATLLTAYGWREWRAHQPAIRPGAELDSLLAFDATAGPSIAALIRHELGSTSPAVARPLRGRGRPTRRSSHEG